MLEILKIHNTLQYLTIQFMTSLYFSVQLYSEEYLDTLQTSKKPQRFLPPKFEIIASLGVGGRWVTQQHDLQVRCFVKILCV